MSKAGKILFAFSVLSFLILGAARLIYGGWDNSFWIPFGMMIFFFIGGIVTDHRAIRDIFGMRTTKHGLNMGAMILIVLVGLVCVNYLSSRYEKKFDWTSDKFNSLSEQSIKAAKALKEPTQLLLLYGKDTGPNADQVQKSAKSLFDMYRNVSDKIDYKAYEALKRPDLAQKYEYTTGAFAFFAVQGERKVKIETPTEESITRALIKLGREKKKVLYFTRGHGELLLDEKGAQGLTGLRDDLTVTYEVKPLALFETSYKVPADADAVAIIGPKQQFLDTELSGLREYARAGGHLLLALDPGTKQNLAQLTRTFGVDYDNDFVLDLRSRALKASPTLVIGSDFSKSSDITKAFTSSGSQFVVFELVSSVKKASDAPAGLKFENLVSTDRSTASVPEMKEKVEYKPNGPHTLAISVTGKLPAGPAVAGAPAPAASTKDFSAVIIGDSDFMANQLLLNNLNRDLVENSVAWLTNDQDLITIRPKQPKGTKLDMPTGSFYALVLSLSLISVALLGASVGFWWRRRSA